MSGIIHVSFHLDLIVFPSPAKKTRLLQRVLHSQIIQENLQVGQAQFVSLSLSAAALGYSTKVYFNACCKPSPLFDVELLLSSLPVSLGPGHLADSMRNVVQLLVDLCVNPEDALNKLPTAAGSVVVYFIHILLL